MTEKIAIDIYVTKLKLYPSRIFQYYFKVEQAIFKETLVHFKLDVILLLPTPKPLNKALLVLHYYYNVIYNRQKIWIYLTDLFFENVYILL